MIDNNHHTCDLKELLNTKMIYNTLYRRILYNRIYVFHVYIYFSLRIIYSYI